jgi:protein involved in polysaccharide export with SLBB domain
VTLTGVGMSLLPADMQTQLQQLQASGGQMGAAGMAQASESAKNIYAFQHVISTTNWPLIIGLFLFYFLGGFLFYASLFAAVGSVVNEDPQDAQSLMFPITMPIIFSYIITNVVIQNPNTPMAFWASVIPFSSPMVMMARVSYGVPTTVPYWELALSMVDGLTQDAYTGRGQIIRLEDDLSRGIRSFEIKKALAGDPENNLLLQREDEVLISSVADLRDTFKISIQGEVRQPGQYDYVNSLTLKDLILQAGGFTDAAYKSIEIARLIERDSIAAGDTRASEIINTEIDGDLASTNANLPLRPYDVITIRRKAGYLVPESVQVSGQVQYPGPYALNNRSERVSSLLKRAGGYTADAYPEGAYLKRYNTELDKMKSQDALTTLQKNVKDSSYANKQLVQEITREFDKIPLDIPAILQAPGSIEDLVLRSKDELYIPKFDGQVKVSGAVLMTTQVPYREKNSLKDYLNDAGGFSSRALRRKTYIVYANGKAAITSHFLFFKSYPKVLPGSEVIVPAKPETKKTSTAEVIGISTAIASLVGVVIALLRL